MKKAKNVLGRTLVNVREETLANSCIQPRLARLIVSWVSALFLLHVLTGTLLVFVLSGRRMEAVLVEILAGSAIQSTIF